MTTYYVESMVIYPPEKRFPEERKYTTPYTTDDPPTECFKGDYWHHNWVSTRPIQRGEGCICGKEVKQ